MKKIDLDLDINKAILLEIIKEVGKLGEGKFITDVVTDQSFPVAKFIGTHCWIDSGGYIVMPSTDLFIVNLSDPEAIEKAAKAIREQCRRHILKEIGWKP